MLTTATVWGVTFVQWGWWMVATLAQSFDWWGGGRGCREWEGRRNRVGEERGGRREKDTPCIHPLNIPHCGDICFYQEKRGGRLGRREGEGKIAVDKGEKGEGESQGEKGEGERGEGEGRKGGGREGRKTPPVPPLKDTCFENLPHCGYICSHQFQILLYVFVIIPTYE